ncbi:nurim isoform X5 [Loxodonta africana]|uniref:nurim isoform X5 n=1 Tax=Loxodonta africana TaxID=9785 RepID=UPI0030D15A81
MAPALLLVPAALASFVLAFGTGVEFVRFTSLRPLLGGVSEAGPDVRQGWLAALQDRSILASLAWDLGLLLLFVGQHSLMATETVKAWSSRYFGVLQRSLYVACTALALQQISYYLSRRVYSSLAKHSMCILTFATLFMFSPCLGSPP